MGPRAETGYSGATHSDATISGATICGVKICGVTRIADAVNAVELGATHVGVNFWPRSPRYVETDVARDIVAAIDGRAQVVGVFVDATSDEVQSIDRDVGLDLLQFHGDEAPERLAPYGHRAIKVFRIDDAFDPRLLEDYPHCGGWLFDVRHADYGGTGTTWNYELVRDLPTKRTVMVAGGVTPRNVREVIERCRPNVVDVCSGVEETLGIKDQQLMIQLFEEIGNEKQVRLA